MKPPHPRPTIPRAVPTRPFELRLTVQSSDLDELQHVNNVVYVKWVQDAAIAHWKALAPAGSQDTIAWVARRHEIDYLSAAVLADELIVRTRVGQAEGLVFDRHTEVLQAATGAVVVRSLTQWVPIDPRTGKPRRVPAEVRALFSTPTA